MSDENRASSDAEERMLYCPRRDQVATKPLQIDLLSM